MDDNTLYGNSTVKNDKKNKTLVLFTMLPTMFSRKKTDEVVRRYLRRKVNKYERTTKI